MLRIGLIWANPYSRNLGVGALAYSSLALLRDVCRDNGISADFTLIGSSGQKFDKVEVNNEVIKFRNILGNDHQKWRSILKLAILPRKYHTTSILSLDIVFDISEGDSFTDIYGENRFQKFINSKIFFNLFRTSQVLLPQTIGPFKSSANEKKAFEVMRKMEMVISRDRESFEYTSSFLPSSQIMEAIDVAFYLGFKRQHFEDGFQHVGINVSALLWNGGYTRKNQFNLKCDYPSLIKDAVEHFYTQPGVKVHFISHVISRRNSVEDDFTVASHFHQMCPGSVLAPAFKTPVEAKDYISGMDFFFGSRMHACIAAFSSGVPVFPLAYSRKFSGLFCETLSYEWLGDCQHQENETILTSLKKAYGCKQQMATEIRKVNSGVVSERLALLKNQLTKSILNGKPAYAEG
jgi:colanic acid/amylovoran biosynthesis protein